MNKKLLFFPIFFILSLSIVAAACTSPGGRGTAAGCDLNEYCSITGTCQILIEDGQSCQDDFQCENYRCIYDPDASQSLCGAMTARDYYVESLTFLQQINQWLQGASNCVDETSQQTTDLGDCSEIEYYTGYKCVYNLETKEFEFIVDCDDCEDSCPTGTVCDSYQGCIVPECDEANNNADNTNDDCTNALYPYCSSSVCVECIDSNQCSNGQDCVNNICETPSNNNNGNNGGGSGGGGSHIIIQDINSDTSVKQRATKSFCGDGICYFGETPESCSEDCPQEQIGLETPSQFICGDGIANPPIENCVNCPQDVKCENNEYCDTQSQKCVEKSSFWLWFIIILIALAGIGAGIYFKFFRKQIPNKSIIQRQKLTAKPQIRSRQQILQKLRQQAKK